MNLSRFYTLGTFLLSLCMPVTMQLYAAEAQSADRATQVQETEKFVSELGNKIIQILVHKETPLAQRKENFRQVLHDNFDMGSIGKFVIARYWRVLGDKQQDYLKLFEDAVVENYASQFDNYQNEKLQVKSSTESQDSGIVVKSIIVRPNKGQPLKVDWKIFKTKRGFKVVDIIVDSVSMSITLRNEYTSVYSERGGADGLLRYLKDKAAGNAAPQTTEVVDKNPAQ